MLWQIRHLKLPTLNLTILFHILQINLFHSFQSLDQLLLLQFKIHKNIHQFLIRLNKPIYNLLIMGYFIDILIVLLHNIGQFLIHNLFTPIFINSKLLIIIFASHSICVTLTVCLILTQFTSIISIKTAIAIYIYVQHIAITKLFIIRIVLVLIFMLVLVLCFVFVFAFAFALVPVFIVNNMR